MIAVSLHEMIAKREVIVQMPYFVQYQACYYSIYLRAVTFVSAVISDKLQTSLHHMT
jgi:hypothetical protein